MLDDLADRVDHLIFFVGPSWVPQDIFHGELPGNFHADSLEESPGDGVDSSTGAVVDREAGRRPGLIPKNLIILAIIN